MADPRLMKRLEAMRYANVKANKFAPRKGDLLTDVMDVRIPAVQIVEVSYVEFDGRVITVQPGKVYDFTKIDRKIVQDWIDRLGLSVVCYGEVMTMKEVKTAEKVKIEEEAAAVPFRVNFGPKEKKEPKKGGRPKTVKK